MKLCEALYYRIERFAQTYNQQHDDVKFLIKKSNTTNSIYLVAESKSNDVSIKKTFRISDHRNSNAKTKIIAKNTKFSHIERLFDSMKNDIRSIRFNVLMNQITANQITRCV
jgi:hypothetical protein